MSILPKPEMQFYIAAAHKSSGKTTISIGLASALSRLGHKVQTFKKGPDYIDPIWLAEASGNPCYNLDFYPMSADEIVSAYQNPSADIKLVEGNKGLYDGLDLHGSDSNAALASLLDIPVVLVVDCTGITRGIAPLLLGYQGFNHPKVKIAGVILNKVGGARHEAKLRAAVQEYTDFTVFGAVAKNPKLAVTERHLGLIPGNEHGETARLIKEMRGAIMTGVDLSLMQESLNNNANRPKTAPAHIQAKAQYPLKIAIAQDEAFGFYYAADLDAFARFGAELVKFSPLHDSALPENIDGIFLGGGFPETHAQQIANNHYLMSDLRDKIINGTPTYAECGGMMILANNLTYDNKTYPMARVISADCTMAKRPQGRGYMQIDATANHIWPDIPKHTIKAHEFHYSRLENFTKDYKYAYQVKRGAGITYHQDGLQAYNLLANYAHLKHSEQFPWVESFLKFCSKIKNV
jgi:cobyrinic acid a,c-diamide synthase